MSTNMPNSEFRAIPFEEKKFLTELLEQYDKNNNNEDLYTFKTLYMLSDFVKLSKAFKNLSEKSSGWKANFARFGQKYDFIDKTFGFREGVYNAIKKQNPDVLQKLETMLEIYRNNNNDNSFEGYQKFVVSIIDILAVSAKQQIHNFKNLAYNKKRTTKFSEEDYIRLIDLYSSEIKKIFSDKGSFILKAVFDNTSNTSNTPNTIAGEASITPDTSAQPGGGRRFNKTRRKKQNKKRKRKYSKKR